MPYFKSIGEAETVEELIALLETHKALIGENATWSTDDDGLVIYPANLRPDGNAFVITQKLV